MAGTSLATAYGGPAYSVSRLASALAAIGVETALWSADQSGLPHDSISAQGVTMLRGTEQEALDAFGRPDVIHDNGLWLMHNHRWASLTRSGGIPRVVSTRGMLEPWAVKHKALKKKLAWLAYQKRDLKSAAVHHASTDAEAANLAAMKLGVPIQVVPNGVDLPDAALLRRVPRGADGDSPRTALFLGRIYPVKGLPMLIEAWKRVMPANWRLRIVGPDEAGHLAVLKRAVAEARLDDVVSFEPAVQGEAKTAELTSADLFVLPTYSESFGMAIAEALAFGLPVLTTTGAPWPQLAALQCGWRVAPTVEALTVGLRDALSSEPETLTAMGARGRELVEREYRWESVARHMAAVYEGCR
jgi:glycosyltransferase involved in cell wall biosynthesis